MTQMKTGFKHNKLPVSLIYMYYIRIVQCWQMSVLLLPPTHVSAHYTLTKGNAFFPANVPASANHGCGTWFRSGQFCVGFISERKPWLDARQYCQQYNGDLVKVDSLDKMVSVTFSHIRLFKCTCNSNKMTVITSMG